MNFVDGLNSKQIEQVLEDRHSLWGSNRTLSQMIEQTRLELENYGSEFYRFCGLVDSNGFVTSSLKRYGLTLSYQGRNFRTLGIGGVFTHPNFRKKGLASNLINHLHETIFKEGYQAALLYSAISPQFYERLGYKKFQSMHILVSASDLPTENPLKYRKANSNDFSKISDWYEKHALQNHVRFLRDKKFWSFFQNRYSKSQYFILSSNEKDLGYLSCEPSDNSDNQLFLIEYFVPKDYAARIGSTLQSLMTEFKVQTLKAWYQPQYTWTSALKKNEREKAITMIASIAKEDVFFDIQEKDISVTPFDYF